MLVVIFILTLTLGYASARDGESCVSTNCLFVDNCFKSVKVGAECSNAAYSGKCGKDTEGPEVDCDKKTDKGESCCVFSRLEGGCECVQRRCHESRIPDKRVPEECLKYDKASPPWWALVLALLVTIFVGVIIVLCLRKRKLAMRMNSQVSQVSQVSQEEQRKTKDLEQNYSLIGER